MNTQLTIGRLLCLGALVALSGCASMSREECVNNDMYSKGVADGEAGYAASRLSSHQEACGKFGIKLDGPTYLAGRQEGLKTYCTPANAEAVGRAGKTYYGVCPADKEAAFNAAYKRGRMQYDIDQLQVRLARIREELSNDKLTAADRRRLTLELDQAHTELALLLVEQARR